MRKIVKEVDPRYLACPIRNVIDKFGDKWSLLVLYHLNQNGTIRFNDLRRDMADCSQKMYSSYPPIESLMVYLGITNSIFFPLKSVFASSKKI